MFYFLGEEGIAFSFEAENVLLHSYREEVHKIHFEVILYHIASD